MAWFLLVIGGLMVIPIAPVLLWWQGYYRSIDSRLEKVEYDLKTFTGIFIPFLIIGLHILKGFGIPWLSENVFYVRSGSVVAVLLLTLIFDIWCPLYPKSRNGYWMLTLLGLYAFMTPWFLLLAPFCFVLAVLVLNSIQLGVLAAIVLMFIPIWTGQLDPLFFASNVGFFITILICNRRGVFLMMDGKKETLLTTFRKRR